MALQHTLLDAATLSAEAQRALGPGPARMMAARGLAPLANPADHPATDASDVRDENEIDKIGPILSRSLTWRRTILKRPLGGSVEPSVPLLQQEGP